MRLKLTLFGACICTLAACATVDVTEVAGAESQVQNQKLSANVVIRSAKNLHAKIIEAGWAKDQETSINSAANMLLKGVNNAPSTKTVSYADTVNSVDTLKSHILLLQNHTEKAQKASEVFLSIAENDADLRDELKYLEKALLSCRKSEANFKAAAAKFNSVNMSELQGLETSVDALRDMTNEYGFRVRAQNSRIGTPAS